MFDGSASAHEDSALRAFFLGFPPLVRRAAAALVVALGLLAVASRITSFDVADLTRNDFTQDYLSARAWAIGEDPYAPIADFGARFFRRGEVASFRPVPADHRNPHTPVALVLTRPFSALDYRTARVVWLVFASVCLMVGVGMFARALGWGWRATLIAAVAALGVPVAQKDLVYGQVNGLLLVLLVSAWCWLRRGQDARAGAALGVAAALKLFPLFLVLPLVRARRVRALGWFAGTAVAVSLACAALVGFDSARRFLIDAAPANFRFWRAAPMNLSLVAAPFRWLVRSAWRPGAPSLDTLATVLALVLLGICVIAAMRTPARLTGDSFWAAAPWMVLATPLAWESSLVLLFPALLLALGRLPASGGSPLPMGVLFASAIVVLGIPPGLPPGASDNSVAVIVLGYGLPTYALGVFAMAEWRRR